MYIEASGKKPGDVAYLQTYRMLPSKYCINYNYHMHGVCTEILNDYFL